MNSLKQSLTQTQLELLALFNRDVDDADWLEIRTNAYLTSLNDFME